MSLKLFIFSTDDAVEGEVKEYNITLLLEEEVVKINKFVYGIEESAETGTNKYFIINRDLLTKYLTLSIPEIIQYQNFPGVRVHRESSILGDYEIFINGSIGFDKSKKPLVLQDGIEVDINDVRPNQLERITILTDGSLASLYGVKAANGVILLTSIEGDDSGVTQYDFTGYYKVKSVTHSHDVLNSFDYANYINSDRISPGTYSAEQLSAFANKSNDELYADTNWEQALYRNGGNESTTAFNLYGGIPKMKVGASFNFTSQSDVLDVNRASGLDFLGNVSSHINEKFGFKVALSVTNFNYIGSSFDKYAYNSHINTRPTITERYNTGSFGTVNPEASFSNFLNPLALLSDGGDSRYDKLYIRSVANFDYSPFEWSKLNARFGFSTTNRNVLDAFIYEESYTNDALSDDSISYQYGLKSFVLSQTTRFTRSFAEATLAIEPFNDPQSEFKLELLGGTGVYFTNSSSELVEGTNFNSTNNYNLSTSSTDALLRPNTNVDTRQLSVFGYASTFYKLVNLDVSARADHIAKVGNGFLTYNFGTDFYIDPFKLDDVYSSDLLTDVNLRVSYSRNHIIEDSFYTENPNVGDTFFQTIANRINGNTDTFVFNYSSVNDYAFNPTMINTFSAGLNTYLLLRKLSVTIDYFNKNISSSVLFTDSYSGLNNLDEYIYNIESQFSNSGVNIGITYKYDVKDILKFSSSLVYNNNSYKFISGESIPTENTFRNNYLNLSNTKYDYGDFVGFEFDGVYSESEVNSNTLTYPNNYQVQAGDPKFKDQNSDGVIDVNDRVSIGTIFPPHTFGINQSLNYKNLSVLLSFSAQFNRNIYVRPNFDGVNNIYSNYFNSDLSLTTDSSSPLYYDSDLHLAKFSFINLQSVGVNYRLGESYFGRDSSIEDIRLSFNANNLFTSVFSGNDGINSIDPKQLISNSNSFSGAAPNPVEISIGFKILFRTQTKNLQFREQNLNRGGNNSRNGGGNNFGGGGGNNFGGGGGRQRF